MYNLLFIISTSVEDATFLVVHILFILLCDESIFPEAINSISLYTVGNFSSLNSILSLDERIFPLKEFFGI